MADSAAIRRLRNADFLRGASWAYRELTGALIVPASFEELARSGEREEKTRGRDRREVERRAPKQGVTIRHDDPHVPKRIRKGRLRSAPLPATAETKEVTPASRVEAEKETQHG